METPQNTCQGYALVDVPFLNLEEYARRTGDTYDNVRRMAVRGLLPTVRLPAADGSNPKKLHINMVALAASALELYQQHPYTPVHVERGLSCA